MAGSATISRIFESAGWSVGPPVDVGIEPWMNLLSPAAITNAMSVIHEGRISLLWLSPPPSETLLDVAARMFLEQSKAGGVAVLELPTSGCGHLYTVNIGGGTPLFHATRDVCMDGAPWKSSIRLLSNSQLVERLESRCDMSHPHINLGLARPNGKLATKVSLECWPAFATKTEEVFHSLANVPVTTQSVHRSGMLLTNPLQTVTHLQSMGFYYYYYYYLCMLQVQRLQ